MSKKNKNLKVEESSAPEGRKFWNSKLSLQEREEILEKLAKGEIVLRGPNQEIVSAL